MGVSCQIKKHMKTNGFVGCKHTIFCAIGAISKHKFRAKTYRKVRRIHLNMSWFSYLQNCAENGILPAYAGTHLRTRLTPSWKMTSKVLHENEAWINYASTWVDELRENFCKILRHIVHLSCQKPTLQPPKRKGMRKYFYAISSVPILSLQTGKTRKFK